MAETLACAATTYSPWVGLKLDVPAQYLDAVVKNPDTVQAALALARLDFVSALLASIGVLLAVAGIFAFISVRVSAKRAARHAAIEEIREELPKLLPAMVADALRTNPEVVLAGLRKEPLLLITILNDAMKAREELLGGLNDEQADNIAESIEGKR